ncbi:hypothetical protein [Aliiroseovarius sp.]|uniref:hypothetical protein n=1 Tax=Aliiroseovarius sp. TaxID=1872442 RepID=UPI003BABAB41
MPLEVLASIVVVGLAAIWIMMRFMGFDRELRFADEAVARAEWAADNPTAPPLDIIVAESGKAALVRNKRGLGLIWTMGLDTASHDLAGAVPRPHPKGLRVVLHDFAAPSVLVELTPDEIPTWHQMIEEAA